MTRIGWWDCLAGASGDMCLAAAIDAGAPIERVQAALDAVDVEPLLLATSAVSRQGVGALRVEVAVPETPIVRTWPNIRELLLAARLAEPVRTVALDAFARLAAAEAVVHRTAPEQVHFHEVGALDALADIVGTAAALHALGVERFVASPVALGSGMTRGEHGFLPVPAPAVLAILASVDAPVYSGPARHETCTPTGAALLAATVTEWSPLPPMRITAVGTGAGDRELDEIANVLRLVVGEATDPAGVAGTGAPPLVLEANVDDLDPRLWPAVLALLLDAGASDTWLTPILMKKGRPAYTLSVLTPADRADAVRAVIFTETSAIGLREHGVAKRALDREVVSVDIDGVPVRVKLARLDGVVVNAAPEYDDIAAAAIRLGRPAKAVLAAATAAAQAAVDWGDGSG